jgi:hypothetical protein
MKFKRMAVLFISVSAVSGIAAFFAGCSRGEDLNDDFARAASQEVSNMDANSSGMILTGLQKVAAAAADSITYDLVIHPYTWDTVGADTFLVRTATLTCSDGYERTRVDTVTFYDNGNTTRHPTLSTVDSIHHVRHVTRNKGGNELSVTVDMHSTVSALDQNGAYTHVKNGTITGTYDGEQAVTGTIVNVTRNYYPLTRWQLFPQSGAITADFPRRLYEVDFLGAGFARLTITNKVTDKVRIITINIEQH